MFIYCFFIYNFFRFFILTQIIFVISVVFNDFNILFSIDNNAKLDNLS